MEVTKKVARFIVETDLENMPPEIVAIVKNAMIDTLGVALAGSLEPLGKIMSTLVKKLGGVPVAGVIGHKVHTSSLNAALANGSMTHALDYDDTSHSTQGHPSAVLIPVILALGEELKSSGREIIEAYALGEEVWAKIGRNLPQLAFEGWHPTAVLGTIGAAAAAAKLFGLNTEQTMMALGLAGSHSAGLIKNFGTMTKPFHAGNAARSGIMAAMLVREGVTATKNILEGDDGLPAIFSGEGTVDVLKMADELGNPFDLARRGIMVKRYPSCYATARPLDAMLHLIDTYDIKPEEVEAVDCQVTPRSIKNCSYNEPKTGLEGKFSLQFVMAVALTDRKIGMAQFTDEKANDPVTKDLMNRVTARVHPDWVEGQSTEARPDVVIVKLKNGKEYSHGVSMAKGHGRSPLTREELLTKYRDCAKLVLGDKDTERCIELIDGLEELKDITELMHIVVD